ncbi:MAG: HD domain-containing protein, partial [Candidatus Doudnabacteria bacterium]|nr:HD domain-containing protein [Candidatus Doudnabacteria bacterium]
MKRPDLDRLIELQRLLQAFGSVDRVVHREHNGTMRQETDVEHSYNLAMTAWFIAPHFPKLDHDLVIRYALVHDLVEVHAGDTYVYGSREELASKHDREAAAASKLAAEWSDFPELHELI